METMTYEQTRTSEREVIEISLPGSVELVVIARFTAATVGARAGFDLDEIDDLRLAVDELSVSFGPLDGDTCLRYEFLRDGGSVTVRCTREPNTTDPTRQTDLQADAEGRFERDLAYWEHARELSTVLLDELVDSHGREVAHGRSVAWLIKQHQAGYG
jgi:anti-sigma regulatory factor (Ser/Thr protein kinase)